MFPKSFRNGGECCPRLETASWKSNGASFSNNLIHCYSTILLIFPLLPPSLVSFTQNETKTRHVLYLKKKKKQKFSIFLVHPFHFSKKQITIIQQDIKTNFLSSQFQPTPFRESLLYPLRKILYVFEKISQSLNSLKIRFNGKKKNK